LEALKTDTSMKQELIDQRKLLMLAVNCINAIEVCDEKIDNSYEIKYYQRVKHDAETQYLEVLGQIIHNAKLLNA
jgi:hypothetical protein